MCLHQTQSMPLDTSSDPSAGTDPLSSAIGAEQKANPQTASVSSPTKFGSLMKLMQPALEGAAVGGFLGRSTPEGGFGAANNFYLQRRMQQMQMGQFLLNMQKMQADMAEKQAQAQWLLRRPGLTRTGQPIKGVDPATGQAIYQTQDPNTGIYAKQEGIEPENVPDYTQVPTDKGFVKFDKHGVAPTLPLTLSGSTEESQRAPGHIAGSVPPGMFGGSDAGTPASAFDSGSPRTPGSPSQSPAAIASSVPLMPASTINATKPKIGKVTNRNAGGAETDNLIDENPNSPTFGKTVKPNVASRAPVPDKIDAHDANKNATGARVESYAAEAMRQSGGDPDKALTLLNNLKISDPKSAKDFQAMLPQIRKSIRDRVKPGRSGKRPRITPADAQSLGLTPSSNASVLDNEDENQ